MTYDDIWKLAKRSFPDDKGNHEIGFDDVVSFACDAVVGPMDAAHEATKAELAEAVRLLDDAGDAIARLAEQQAMHDPWYLDAMEPINDFLARHKEPTR